MTRLRHIVAGLRPRPHWLLALGLAAAVLFVGSASTPTEAQATRTWVSGVGDDANPCSRTAPCKTFAGAISKTAAGGIIDCLDPGGFGTLTITKSISIDCNQTLGSILASGTNGINVSTPNATDVVFLRGLSIEGSPGTGTIGVNFIGQGSLFIENCVIYQFSGGATKEGVHVANSNTSKIFIKDTVIRDNGVSGALGGGGLHVARPAAGSTQVDLDNVRLEHNGNSTGGFGAKFDSNVLGTIRNSTATDNSEFGFWAQVTGAGTANMKLTNSSATEQLALTTSAGVRSDGNGASWVVDNSFFTDNANAMSAVNSGVIFSFGNNRSFGNLFNNGTPTSTVGPQ